MGPAARGLGPQLHLWASDHPNLLLIEGGGRERDDQEREEQEKDGGRR